MGKSSCRSVVGVHLDGHGAMVGRWVNRDIQRARAGRVPISRFSCHLISMIGILLGFGGIASAQTDAYRRNFPANGRVELALGGFTPNSVETRTDDTSTWTRFSVSMRLGKAPGPVSSFLFLDLAGQSGRVVDTNGVFEIRRRRSFVGLGGGWMASTPIPGSRWAFDASAGLGVSFLEIAEDFADGAGTSLGPSQVIDRAAGVGLRLRGAVRDPRGWFIEMVWQDPGSMRGLSYAGASIAVGKRL